MAIAYLPDYSDKRMLIVDDVADMRTALRGQVRSLAIEHVAVAGTIRDALEILQQGKIDIILCDYYLGEGLNGQQFLEFVRRHKVISRSTLFLMITAEKSYERVVTAAECLPDDYLLKPFTADMLRTRLDRLLEKKSRLAHIDRLQDQGRWSDIVTACNEIIAAKDKYLMDAMRIKGNALVITGRMAEAAEHYRSALALRALPWAKLGLANALRGQGDLVPCADLLNEIISETPHFMAAYDLLGQVHAGESRHEEALRVLDSACAVSPNSLARHRAISGIAEGAGDLRRVETALNFVIERTRNSPLRESSDYARLGSALTELGEAPKALAVIEEGKATFHKESDTTLLAAVEAVAHQKNGNTYLAGLAIERALQGAGNEAVPLATTMALAKGCLATGRAKEGEALLRRVVQNNPALTAVHAEVVTMMTVDGDTAPGEQLVTASKKEIVKLNNDAVAIARSGDITRAAQMLTEAAGRLPGNLVIVANAAYALLADLLANGMDAGKLRDAERLYKDLGTKDPQHPRLAEIAGKFEQVHSRYDVAEAP